jgi:hypothetical protein
VPFLTLQALSMSQLIAGRLDYPMPGYPGKYVSKQFWGDISLSSGANVHARIFGSFSGVLLEDLLAEMPPLTQDDVIITNFGAWYPRFVKQVGVTILLSWNHSPHCQI